MQVKANNTSVPDQNGVRRSHQKQNTKRTSQGRTTQRNQTNPPRGQTRPHRRRSHKHQQDKGPQGGQTKPTKRGRGGRREAEAIQEGKSRRPGRHQNRREKAAQAKKAGACSFSGVRSILDHTRANTSVTEREAHEQHEQHPQHGVEGRAPHRAEAFVARKRSEDRSQSTTTHHTKGMRTGLLQIQPDIRREDQQNTDWTRKHQETTKGGSQERAGQTASTKATRADNNKTTTTTKHRAATTRERSPVATRKESQTRSAQAQANRNRDNQGKQEMRGREDWTQTHYPKPKMPKVIRGLSIPAQSADRDTYTQCLTEN